MLRIGRLINNGTGAFYSRRIQTSVTPLFVSKSPTGKSSGLDTTANNVKGAMSEMDFRNTKDAYRSKTTRDVFRAYSVFKFCSYDTLLKYQKQLLSMSRKVLGQTLFKRLMRMTIYGQFMAGEVRNEILESAHKHHRFGVRPMFAYTASESHGLAEGMLGSDKQREILDINFEAMKDCIEMAALSPREDGEYVKISGKLTFIATAETYRAATTLIDDNTKIVHTALEKSLSDVKWKKILEHLQDIVISQKEGGLVDVANKYKLPVPSTYREFNWEGLTTCLAFHLAASEDSILGTLLRDVSMSQTVLSHNSMDDLVRAFDRFNYLSERSKENGICLVLDAEQTYLQLAMDLTALDLMRIHNTERPVVHNTYQCYLRRTYDIITRDLTVAKAEGFRLGAKVVRGGYLDEERMLAAKHGYLDPVNPTFEATSAMYFKVAEELLQQVLQGTKLQITFATHNEDTVKHLIQLLNDHELSPDRNVLSFAQLLGMRDHVAFLLGKAGIPANKLLHYGPVEDCVAYLSRRITENKSGVPTANIEREMLSSEISRRWRERELFR